MLTRRLVIRVVITELTWAKFISDLRIAKCGGKSNACHQRHHEHDRETYVVSVEVNISGAVALLEPLSQRRKINGLDGLIGPLLHIDGKPCKLEAGLGKGEEMLKACDVEDGDGVGFRQKIGHQKVGEETCREVALVRFHPLVQLHRS